MGKTLLPLKLAGVAVGAVLALFAGGARAGISAEQHCRKAVLRADAAFSRCLTKVDARSLRGRAADDTHCLYGMQRHYERIRRNADRRRLAAADCPSAYRQQKKAEGRILLAHGRVLGPLLDAERIAALELCSDGTRYDTDSGACVSAQDDAVLVSDGMQCGQSAIESTGFSEGSLQTPTVTVENGALRAPVPRCGLDMAFSCGDSTSWVYYLQNLCPEGQRWCENSGSLVTEAVTLGSCATGAAIPATCTPSGFTLTSIRAPGSDSQTSGFFFGTGVDEMVTGAPYAVEGQTLITGTTRSARRVFDGRPRVELDTDFGLLTAGENFSATVYDGDGGMQPQGTWGYVKSGPLDGNAAYSCSLLETEPDVTLSRFASLPVRFSGIGYGEWVHMGANAFGSGSSQSAPILAELATGATAEQVFSDPAKPTGWSCVYAHLMQPEEIHLAFCADSESSPYGRIHLRWSDSGETWDASGVDISSLFEATQSVSGKAGGSYKIGWRFAGLDAGATFSAGDSLPDSVPPFFVEPVNTAIGEPIDSEICLVNLSVLDICFSWIGASNVYSAAPGSPDRSFAGMASSESFDFSPYVAPAWP